MIDRSMLALALAAPTGALAAADLVADPFASTVLERLRACASFDDLAVYLVVPRVPLRRGSP